jgi:hypothetical protein
MTNEQFIQSIEKSYADGVALIKIKNADYANPTNPFKNFESAIVADVDVKRAILIRVLDKISRISNLLEREPKVVEEKLEDTVLDCCNYLAILKAKIEDESTN